jgi:hypothetical protein
MVNENILLHFTANYVSMNDDDDDKTSADDDDDEFGRLGLKCLRPVDQ